MDHAHEAEDAARGPACDIDGQILAMWRALRSNPSLDARWAMQVIDRPAFLPEPRRAYQLARATVRAA